MMTKHHCYKYLQINNFKWYKCKTEPLKFLNRYMQILKGIYIKPEIKFSRANN